MCYRFNNLTVVNSYVNSTIVLGSNLKIYKDEASKKFEKNCENTSIGNNIMSVLSEGLGSSSKGNRNIYFL